MEHLIGPSVSSAVLVLTDPKRSKLDDVMNEGPGESPVEGPYEISM